MTPQEQVVAYVKSQVGYYATAAKRNKYAQALDALGYIYNGKKNGYDWCDVFADHAYIHCFGADKAIKMIAQPKYGCGAGCPWSADYYRSAGQWSDSPSLVRGQGIAGYGVPKWSLAGGSDKVEPAPTPSGKLIVDGMFGSETCKALQNTLQKQGYYKGYLLDGEFGYYTKLELQKYLKKRQYYKGYNLDGDFGYYSVLGLQKYLRKLGYYSKDYYLDGSWGKYTTMALQKALNDGKF